MPAPKDSVVVQKLLDLHNSIDRAIALAKSENWELLNEESDNLGALFDAVNQIDFVRAHQAAQGISAETADHIALVLAKIEQLTALLTPQHQELTATLVDGANSQKLRQAYGS